MEEQLPILKQFLELTPNDFKTYPVWISCHIEDYDEPWYDDTDEETYRPWTKELPVSPEYGAFLVSASFVLNDGTQMDGFLTPDIETKSPDELGTIQPHIFTSSGPINFWTGMLPVDSKTREKFYTELDKEPSQIFPIRFKASDELTTGLSSGIINGFLTIPDGQTVQVIQ